MNSKDKVIIKVTELYSYLKKEGFKKESAEVFKILKTAWTPGNIADPVVGPQIGRYYVEESKKGGAGVELRDLVAATLLESIFEVPATTYYAGEAVSEEDYEAAGLEVIIGMFPLLPRKAVRAFLRFVLPKKFQSTKLLLEELEDEGIPLTKDQAKEIIEELNRRREKHSRSAKAIEDRTNVYNEDNLLLEDSSLNNPAKMLPDNAPGVLKNRDGIISFDPKGKQVNFDSNRLKGIDSQESVDLEHSTLRKILDGAKKLKVKLTRKQHNRIMASIPKDLKLNDWELARNFRWESVKDHGEFLELLKERCAKRIKEIEDHAKEYRWRDIQGLESKVRTLKQDFKRRFPNPNPDPNPMNWSSYELGMSQDIISYERKLEKNLSREKDIYRAAEKYKDSIKFINDEGLAEVRRKELRLNAQLISDNKIKSITEVDMTNLDKQNLSFLTKELGNEVLDIKKIEGRNAQEILNKLDLDPEFNLPKNWMRDGDVLYHTEKNIPISSLSVESLTKLREISVINNHNKSKNPDGIIKTVLFL